MFRDFVSTSSLIVVTRGLTSISYTFDLYREIPFASLDEATRYDLWDDGVHLTSKGYQKMGDAIAVRLFEILQEQGKQERTASMPTA